MRFFLESKILLTTLLVIIASLSQGESTPVTVSNRNYIQKDIIEFKNNTLVLRDNGSLSRKQLKSILFTDSLKSVDSLFTGQVFSNKVKTLFSKIDSVKKNYPNDNLVLIENTKSYELQKNGSILHKSTKFYYCKSANLVNYKQLDFAINQHFVPLKLTAVCHSADGEIVNLINKDRYKTFDNIRVRQNQLLNNSVIVTHSELLEQPTWHKQIDLKVSFSRAIPTVEENLTITIPKGKDLLSSTPPTKKIELVGDELREAYSWSSEELSKTEKISITTFKNWSSIADYYLTITNRCMVLSEESKQFFQELLTAKAEKQSAEEFIYKWIQTNITPNRASKTVETLNTAEQILNVRLGTTSEKNLLFCAILNTLKIDAQLLLFSTYDEVNSSFPTVKLPKTIAYLEKDKLLVSLADRLAPMQTSSDDLEEINYLNLKSKTIQPFIIDHAKKKANTITAKAILDTETKLININVSITFYGSNQVMLRRALRKLEKKQQLSFINKEFFNNNCTPENITISDLKVVNRLTIIANHSLQNDVFELGKNKYAIYLPNLLIPFTSPIFNYKNHKISGKFKLNLKKGTFLNKIAKQKNSYTENSATLALTHSLTEQELDYSFELELKNSDSPAILKHQIQSLIQPFLISVN